MVKKFCIIVALILIQFLNFPIRTNAQGQNLDFTSIFNEHGSIMLIIDQSNGNIVFANLAAREFYGFAESRWQNINISEINTLTPAEIAAEMRKAALEERNFFVFRHRLASGEIRTVEVYSYPYHMGDQTFLLSIIYDVTLKRALNQEVTLLQSLIFYTGLFSILVLILLVLKLNKSLKQVRIERTQVKDSQQQLRNVIDNIQGVVYRCKFDQYYTMEFLSQGIVQLTGYEEEDLIDNKTLSFASLIPEDHRMNFEELADVFEIEYPIITKNKTIKWVMDRAKVIFDNDGNRKSIEGIISDITKRKELESELLRSQTQLMHITRNISEVVFLMDTDYRIQFVNETIYQVVGVTQDQFIANPSLLFDLIHSSDRQRANDKFDEYQVTGIFNEVCAIHRNGNVCWIQCIIKPVIDAERNVEMHVGSIIDVTKSVEATIELQQSVDKLTKVMDNDVVGVMYWQTDIGVMVDANDTMLNMIGYTREDLNERRLNRQALTPVEFIDLSLKEMENFGVTGKIGPYEKQYICKDGSRKWFLFAGNALDDKNAIEFCVDISNQKYNYQVLNSTQVLANVGNYTVELSTQNYFASEVLSQLLGLLPQPHRVIEDHLQWIYHEDQAMVRRLFEQFLMGIVPFDIEYRMVKEDSNATIWVRDIAQLEYDNNDKPLRVHGIIMDITLQKQQNLSLQLQKERLSTLLHFSNAMRIVNNTKSMFDVLLDEASKMVDVKDCAVTLLSEDKRYFVFSATRGTYNVLQDRHFSIHEGLNGRVYRKNEVVVTQNYSDENDRLQGIEAFNALGPVVLIPLRSESHLIGVLSVARLFEQQDNPFSTFEIETLTTIGEIAGSAMQRIILLDTLKERLDYIQALHNIDIEITKGSQLTETLKIALHEINNKFDIVAATALVYNDKDVTMKLVSHIGMEFHAHNVVFPLHHHAIIEKVATTKKSYFIENLHEQSHYALPEYLKQELFVSYVAFPMFANDKMVGMLELCCATTCTMTPEENEFVETIANHCAFAIEKDTLLRQLKQSNRELLHAYDATIKGWAHALILKDQETKEHSSRVTELTLEMARRCNVPDSDLIHVRRGALLHDIGKIGIPDHILQSTNTLSEEEWKLMKQHPVYAYEMLSEIAYLRPAIDIPYYHHEKWDGSGYPLGLKHTQIPLVARIFAVVDVYDALTSDRPYRKAWSKQAALDYIVSQKGLHFDPEVVNEFIKMMSFK